MQGSLINNARLALPVYLVLFLLLIITSIISPDFRSPDNIINVTSQVAPLAIVAIGQTIVLLLAGIDLSVGSVVSFSTVIMALLSTDGTAFSLWGSILLALAIGAIVGIVNGIGVASLDIPPLIMTLSTMSILKGVSLFLMSAPGGMVSIGFMEFMTSTWGIISVMGITIIILYIITSFA